MEHHFLHRTGMILGLHGVVFHGADARDAQKSVGLQNNTNNVEQLIKIIETSGRGNFRELKNEMLGIV